MGQSGLLQEDRREDDYYTLLKREYQYQQKKYKLSPVTAPVHFLRMRPGNFPTVRLAQLAMRVHHSAHLFSKIKEANSLKEVKAWFDIMANDYWHYHYRLDEPSSLKRKKLGDTMIDNIVINTICPLIFAYGVYHDEQRYKDKSLFWLEQTTAEKNNITKGFQQAGLSNKNAFDSQALIELKNEYCNKKRCLECGVGNVLLKEQ